MLSRRLVDWTVSLFDRGPKARAKLSRGDGITRSERVQLTTEAYNSKVIRHGMTDKRVLGQRALREASLLQLLPIFLRKVYALPFSTRDDGRNLSREG